MDKPKLTDKQLRRLAEKIRFQNTSDETYDTLLSFIAEDVYDRFAPGASIELHEFLENITKYIKTWRP